MIKLLTATALASGILVAATAAYADQQNKIRALNSEEIEHAEAQARDAALVRTFTVARVGIYDVQGPSVGNPAPVNVHFRDAPDWAQESFSRID